MKAANSKSFVTKLNLSTPYLRFISLSIIAVHVCLIDHKLVCRKDSYYRTSAMAPDLIRWTELRRDNTTLGAYLCDPNVGAEVYYDK